MPITGKAKTEYQREYMRRRRAGLHKAKPQTGSKRDEQEIARLKAQIAGLKADLRNAKAGKAKRKHKSSTPRRTLSARR
jgi:predicted alpha/beta-hydrolase family hydrolase